MFIYGKQTAMPLSALYRYILAVYIPLFSLYMLNAYTTPKAITWLSRGMPRKEVPSDVLLSGRNDTAVAMAIVPKDVSVKEYFHFIDSLVLFHDPRLSYSLTEHVLVQHNAWIIDTLRHSDYYHKKAQGIFVFDQPALTVLCQGDTLYMPGVAEAMRIKNRLRHTLIDVNIPEYTLRIIVFDTVRYTFPVRVGRNERKYLKTAGRVVPLQTPIGEGTIVRIARNPYFVDPVSGRKYSHTKRDDGVYTRMPQVPWLEPMINGERQGALIHPTTNPKTLGKASSHGCVGTEESAAWTIYYHAPPGTKVKFRYDLTVPGAKGDTVHLPDIYHIYRKEPFFSKP